MQVSQPAALACSSVRTPQDLVHQEGGTREGSSPLGDEGFWHTDPLQQPSCRLYVSFTLVAWPMEGRGLARWPVNAMSTAPSPCAVGAKCHWQRWSYVLTAEISPQVFFTLHIYSSWLFPCQLFSHFLPRPSTHHVAGSHQSLGEWTHWQGNWAKVPLKSTWPILHLFLF